MNLLKKNDWSVYREQRAAARLLAFEEVADETIAEQLGEPLGRILEWNEPIHRLLEDIARASNPGLMMDRIIQETIDPLVREACQLASQGLSPLVIAERLEQPIRRIRTMTQEIRRLYKYQRDKWQADRADLARQMAAAGATDRLIISQLCIDRATLKPLLAEVRARQAEEQRQAALAVVTKAQTDAHLSTKELKSTVTNLSFHHVRALVIPTRPRTTSSVYIDPDGSAYYAKEGLAELLQVDVTTIDATIRRGKKSIPYIQVYWEGNGQGPRRFYGLEDVLAHHQPFADRYQLVTKIDAWMGRLANLPPDDLYPSYWKTLIGFLVYKNVTDLWPTPENLAVDLKPHLDQSPATIARTLFSLTQHGYLKNWSIIPREPDSRDYQRSYRATTKCPEELISNERIDLTTGQPVRVWRDYVLLLP